MADALKKHGVADPRATEVAKQIGDYLAKTDEAAEKKGELKVKTLMFLSPAEVDAIAKSLAEIVKKDPKAKDLEKAVAKACKSAGLKDAGDIAVFGRMVASDHSLTLEGAGMFSHALSTHRAENEIDFFSAVDDLQKAGEAGAGMTGTLEFTSASYYRYVGLNLDLLGDTDHLVRFRKQSAGLSWRPSFARRSWPCPVAQELHERAHATRLRARPGQGQRPAVAIDQCF